VFRIARKKIASLSLGTVYRNLRLLVSDGLIREVQSAGKAVRYDGMLEAHSHFQCTACDTIIDLPNPAGFAAVKQPQLKGCEVKEFKLDLIGLCAACLQPRKG
jgi:Fur family ferric uptake transcriptional regulator